MMPNRLTSARWLCLSLSLAWIITISPLDRALAAPLLQTNVCANPANPIVAENCLAGTADWLIADDYTDTISGYASTTSVRPGETLDFFVTTVAPVYQLSIE